SMTMSSYLTSAAAPGRPTTSSAYLARADLPLADNWSWILSIVSEPAMLAVPVQGAPDTVAQRHARVVADLPPGARNVEGAALRVEVDASPVQRRLDPERRAERLAHGASRPERPYREMKTRWADSGNVSDRRHQLVQGRHFSTGKD